MDVSKARGICVALVVLVFGAGCASTRNATVNRSGSMGGSGDEVGTASVGSAEVGVASYYAHKYHGRKTASGEKYNMHEMTAAHRRLPFGAKVRVTNLSNNSSVVVRVNDRGPFVKGRVIDVSLAAAKKLDLVRTGVAKVEVVPVSGGAKRVAAVTRVGSGK